MLFFLLLLVSQALSLTCQDGYFPNAAGSACVACTPVPNCQAGWTTCTSSTTSKCSYCSWGYFRAQSDAVCQACTACVSPQYNTNYCQGNGVTDTHTCATCALPASSHCASISCGQTGPVCVGCQPGYTLSAGVCSSCAAVANCQIVNCSSGTSKCSYCSFGYRITPTGTCVACGTCTTSQFTTKYCLGNTTTDTHTCVACNAIAGCASYSCTATGSVCSTCQQGFYKSGNTCPACTLPTNCLVSNCTSATTPKCQQCKSGFYISATGTCVACAGCTPPNQVLYSACSGITRSDTHVCAVCTAADNTACASVTCGVPIGNCTACFSGYYLNAGKCTACKAVANCRYATCTSGTASTCTFCNANFYLKAGACVACAGCTSPQYLTAGCMGNTTTDTHVCATCTVPTGCASVSCDATGPHCQSCLTGFALSGDRCTSTAAASESKVTIEDSPSGTTTTLTSTTDGYSGGVVAGIVIGTVAGTVLVLLAVIFVMKSQSKAEFS